MTSEEAIAKAKSAVEEQKWGWIEPVYAKQFDRPDGGKSWWVSTNDPDLWIEHTKGSGNDIEIDDITGAVLYMRTGIR